MVKIIGTERTIILNDKMLQDIKFKEYEKYDSVWQENRMFLKCEKYVYSQHNEVFNLSKLENSPKCKCVFYFHNAFNRCSSTVEIFDRNNVSIGNGNYLWKHHSEKSFEDYVNVIKLLHSVYDVKQNYAI